MKKTFIKKSLGTSENFKIFSIFRKNTRFRTRYRLSDWIYNVDRFHPRYKFSRLTRILCETSLFCEKCWTFQKFLIYATNFFFESFFFIIIFKFFFVEVVRVRYSLSRRCPLWSPLWKSRTWRQLFWGLCKSSGCWRRGLCILKKSIRSFQIKTLTWRGGRLG